MPGETVSGDRHEPHASPCPFLLVGAISLPAAAQSCYVHSETSGAVPAPVVTEQCFEFHGVDKDDAINWVCQDNEAVKNSPRDP